VFISSRFDGGVKEAAAREIERELKKKGFETYIVDTAAADGGHGAVAAVCEGGVTAGRELRQTSNRGAWFDRKPTEAWVARLTFSASASQDEIYKRNPIFAERLAYRAQESGTWWTYQTCNLTSTCSAVPFRPHEQRASRRPAFRAQPLPQEIDGELIRARDSGRRGDDVDHDGRRLHEGKGYPQELTQPDTCPLRSGPRAK